jgi:hypothetical protein
MYYLFLLLIIFPQNDYSLLYQKKIIPGNNSRGPYLISPFIIKDSLEVLVNGEKKQYTISYEKGVLFFNKEIKTKDTIYCVYEKLPFNIKTQYYHRTPEEDESIPVEENPVVKTPSSCDSKIKILGTKNFGLSFGSRKDLSLDQSMELNITGTVGDNIKVNGVLKDDKTPIQPEGTTEKLEDMDRMYINIDSRTLSCTFGDFDLQKTSALGNINRFLEGVEARVEKGPGTYYFSGAMAKGKFKTKRLIPIFGKQGPYILSENGVIVAGSEKVYVNGEIKKRGRDYIIDYGESSITFTQKVVIRGDEDVLVHFEVKDEGYQRQVYAVSMTTKPSKTTTITSSFFREGDRKDSPLNVILTPERKELLTKAGDGKEEVWIPGERWVGSMKGDYTREDTIFVYRGYKKGDYKVNFTNVGTGSGDYDYNPIFGGFEFVGMGFGRYTPKIKIPLPESHTFSEIGIKQNIGDIRLNAIGNLTRRDQNSFSPGNNVSGNLYSLSFSLNKPVYTVGANIERISKTFYFPGIWNESDSLFMRGRNMKAFYRLEPFSFVKLTGEWLKGERANKTETSINLGKENLPQLTYQYLYRKSKRKNNILGSYTLGDFTPFISYSIEDEKEKKNRIYGGGIKNSFLNIEYGEEKTDTMDGKWDYLSRAKTVKLSLLAPNTRRRDLAISFVHRETVDREKRANLNLGNLRLRAGYEKGEAILNYDLTSREKTLFEEIYYEVKDGEGSYSIDTLTHRYYPDEYGNYEKRLIPLDFPVIVKQFSFYNVFKISPVPLIDAKVTVVKRGEGENINIWKRDTSAIMDRNSARIDLFFLNDLVNLSAGKEDYRDSRTVGIHNSGYTKDIDITGCFNISTRMSTKIGVNLETALRHSKEEGLKWMEHKRAANGELNYNIREPANLSIKITGNQRKIIDPIYSPANPSIEISSISLSPSLSYSGKKGGVNTKLGVIKRFADSPLVPVDIGALYPTGITIQWGIKLFLCPRERVRYSISYNGKDLPKRTVDHSLSANARVFF